MKSVRAVPSVLSVIAPGQEEEREGHRCWATRLASPGWVGGVGLLLAAVCFGGSDANPPATGGRTIFGATSVGCDRSMMRKEGADSRRAVSRRCWRDSTARYPGEILLGMLCPAEAVT
jgi:hypothetical protein